MYFWGSESLQDVSGAVLIPTQFVWPYGGTRVFVSGTFTRPTCQQCNAHYQWSEPVPMSPVEGFPNVFQAICGVAPGLHQYKFYVDDEWRHDEQQPHVKGSHGMVNTLLLTRGTNPVPPILSPATPERKIKMDEDNDVFQHVVKISADPMQEVTLRISEADVEIFRRCISVLLSTHTAYELLPESGKVIALDVNLPVKQAFHILYEQGLPIAPLWNPCKGQFVGVLSPLDFILILRELGGPSSKLTQEEIETCSISAWKEGKQLLNGQVDGHGRPAEKQLVHAGACDSLKDVAIKILRNSVAMVPIVHSVSDDEFPRLLHIASLSGILRCICRHLRHSYSFLPILHQPICTIPLGTWIHGVGETNGCPLAMLRPNTTLGSALALLVQARVSSIPIVNEYDALLDTYSRSDIIALAKDRAYAKIRLDEMSIYEAIQLRQDASSPYGFSGGQECQLCLRTDPLQKVIEKLTKPGVRRLIIVEAGSKQVEGIISLSDVFRFLLGWSSSQNNILNS